MVDVAGCTLCLACVGACPTGALLDNPDRPMLRFVEDACVQCGLCRSTCPEKVISLEPRLNFTDAARQPALIKEEEPCAVHPLRQAVRHPQSSIERIVEKLAGKALDVPGQAARSSASACATTAASSCSSRRRSTRSPGPARPMTRTTDDYLRERERAARTGAPPPDKLHS